jgi:actin-related protein
MAGAVDGDVFIGAKAQELRGLLKIRYPLEHGIVTDWDDMEKIWSYIYSEELKTLPEEVSHTLLGPFGVVRTLIGVAPGVVDRGAVESTRESRPSCADLLRDV